MKNNQLRIVALVGAVTAAGVSACLLPGNDGDPGKWPVDAGPGSDATVCPPQGSSDPACLPPNPVREPTPCLDARAEDAFPVRKISEGGQAPDDEPSAGIVIFDRSGSMGESWDASPISDPPEEPGPAYPRSKWDAAGDALLGAAEPIAARVSLGALFFPQGGDCSVNPIDHPEQIPLQPGVAFLTAWDEAAGRNRPGGATPLEVAFIQAEKALEAACQAGALDQRFYVMVITDGEPNCETDMGRVEAMAEKWRAHGVPTYVFGLPGSEDASAVLQGLSTAGGTEALIVPGSPAELGEDLAVIM